MRSDMIKTMIVMQLGRYLKKPDLQALEEAVPSVRSAFAEYLEEAATILVKAIE